MSDLPVLSLEEAIASPKNVLLIQGHLSANVQKVGKTLRSYLGRGELPMYVETLRRAALEPATDGGTYCHNNTLALAGDLWKVGHKGWCILLGDRGPERGFHSWLECGDTAVDTTFNKMILSLKGYHHGVSKVREARGFTGSKGFDEYLSACRQVGLVGSAP
jgi:hypothetical protein